MKLKEFLVGASLLALPAQADEPKAVTAIDMEAAMRTFDEMLESCGAKRTGKPKVNVREVPANRGENIWWQSPQMITSIDVSFGVNTPAGADCLGQNIVRKSDYFRRTQDDYTHIYPAMILDADRRQYLSINSLSRADENTWGVSLHVDIPPKPVAGYQEVKAALDSYKENTLTELSGMGFRVVSYMGPGPLGDEPTKVYDLYYQDIDQAIPIGGDSSGALALPKPMDFGPVHCESTLSSNDNSPVSSRSNFDDLLKRGEIKDGQYTVTVHCFDKGEQ